MRGAMKNIYAQNAFYINALETRNQNQNLKKLNLCIPTQPHSGDRNIDTLCAGDYLGRDWKGMEIVDMSVHAPLWHAFVQSYLILCSGLGYRLDIDEQKIGPAYQGSWKWLQ